jgi:dimethylhistidine N-methyltransferase
MADSQASRFTLIERGSSSSSLSDDVRRGLTATPKSLPPHHFYDELGSALFDAITRLPEYYVTRAETEVLAAHADEIAGALGEPVRLIELGAGSGRKTRLLFDAVFRRQKELEYVPIDVDPTILERSARDLLDDYPSLHITAIASDFREPSRALTGVLDAGVHNIVLFLGSTIGNLDFEESIAMFRDLRTILRDGDSLFLGADLKKSKSVLEPAYDDALGVTAAFNLNVLQRINRELGANFDLKRFAHRAFFNEECSRIEMHLVSREAQSVHIEAAGLDIRFAAGESIHTENSHKYDVAAIGRMARESGFAMEKHWTDSKQWFADFLLRR